MNALLSFAARRFGSSFPRKRAASDRRTSVPSSIVAFAPREEEKSLDTQTQGLRNDARLRGNDGKRILLSACLLLSFIASPAFAQANQQADAAPLQFNSAAEEARFHALTLQLRCVMCQNQSLADSNALIALQLRREVLDLMRQGRSDEQIKDYLVQRYGEFVLYKPKLEGGTLLLWIGPAVLLLAGAGVVVVIVRRRKPSAVPAANDDGQEW